MDRPKYIKPRGSFQKAAKVGMTVKLTCYASKNREWFPYTIEGTISYLGEHGAILAKRINAVPYYTIHDWEILA